MSKKCGYWTRLSKVVNHLVIGCFIAILCVIPISATSQEKAPDTSYRVRSIVNNRLGLPSRTPTLRLAQQSDIPVQLHGYAVHSVFAVFEYLDSAGNPLFVSPGKEATVKYHQDGTAYIEVVPETVGKAHLRLEVCFEDGGAQSATVDADVILPDEKPVKFLVERGGGGGDRTTGTIYMDLSAMSNHINLGPMAVYSEGEKPVPIPDENVQYKIISANAADPPIRMDPTSGRITALHFGHALVRSRFEDFSDLTCVDVMENASDGGDRTNCAELVPVGMTAPLRGTEGKKPPSKIKVAPEP